MTEHSFCKAEALLHGMKKTQKGCVVSFLLHHADIPNELLLAELNTRVVLAVAEIVDEAQTAEASELDIPQFLKR